MRYDKQEHSLNKMHSHEFTMQKLTKVKKRDSRNTKKLKEIIQFGKALECDLLRQELTTKHIEDFITTVW